MTRAQTEHDLDHLSVDQSVRNAIASVATRRDAVAIEGEAGTAMLAVAKAIYSKSSGNKDCFLQINCLGLTDAAIERELFGSAGDHPPSVRSGILQLARGGTLFLKHADHIGYNCQSRILRHLAFSDTRQMFDEHDLSPPRIIIGVETPLTKLHESGRLATALFNVLSKNIIRLSTLRDRKRDLLSIIDSMLNKQVGGAPSELTITSDALDALRSYSWPGNDRELETVLRRAVSNADGNVIDLSCLPIQVVHERRSMFALQGEHMRRGGKNGPVIELLSRYTRRSEAAYIRSIIHHLHGNKLKAAQVLGISVTTLYRKLRIADAIDENL